MQAGNGQTLSPNPCQQGKSHHHHVLTHNRLWLLWVLNQCYIKLELLTRVTWSNYDQCLKYDRLIYPPPLDNVHEASEERLIGRYVYNKGVPACCQSSEIIPERLGKGLGNCSLFLTCLPHQQLLAFSSIPERVLVSTLTPGSSLLTMAPRRARPTGQLKRSARDRPGKQGPDSPAIPCPYCQRTSRAWPWLALSTIFAPIERPSPHNPWMTEVVLVASRHNWW